jgi:fructose-bisphosphate aldolase, class II
MPLANGLEVLSRARREHYGVGAFNCINIEFLRAVVDTAVSLNSPVILALTPGALKYSGWEALFGAARALADAAPVPVVIHLDHGTKIEEVEQAARLGFSSIMIDGAALSFEDNIAITKRAVQIAHAAGASLEAELGEIGGKEEEIESGGVMTDPARVPEFVAATGLDVLAPAFGSVHQKEKRDASLDLVRLELIAAATSAPLVLHGGSGVPKDQVQGAIARGVAKVNVGTEMQRTFTRVLRETLAANPTEWDARKFLKPASVAVAAAVQERIEMCGSSGKV